MEDNGKIKVVVLSGAGISAESGLSTFRDQDGLWENYSIEDVCTPRGLARDPKLVVEFYNMLYSQSQTKQPNLGHTTIAELERDFDVDVITQNVDDLHEKAGSSRILHLHGELSKVRSSVDPTYIVERSALPSPLTTVDDLAPDGSMLRPHIVFFEEAVPNIEPATEIVAQADVFIIVGTSLAVYPAASLIDFTRADADVYLVDPGDVRCSSYRRITFIKEKASVGVPMVAKILREKYMV